MCVGKALLFMLLTCLYRAIAVNDESSEMQYYGEEFPIKYLLPEQFTPKTANLKLYVKSLRRTVYYFNKTPNRTDCNVALGVFFTKGKTCFTSIYCIQNKTPLWCSTMQSKLIKLIIHRFFFLETDF